MKKMLSACLLAISLCVVVSPAARAQTTDSLLIINPGISPSVAPYRHLDLALYNQLNTEKSEFRLDTINLTRRYTAVYHTLQIGYGVDRTNRLNLGGAFVFAHTRTDAQAGRSPFAVFGSADADAVAYHQPAALGLYARGIPLRRLPELTVQVGAFFPIAADKAARAASGYDRTLTQLQLAFYQQFSPVFYVFAAAEADVLWSNTTRRQTSVSLPVHVYPVLRLGYDGKVCLFGDLGYSGQFNKVSPGFLKRTGQRVLLGLGGQYYIQPAFSLYLFGQVPPVLQTESATTTLLKKGTFTLSLGARWVWGAGVKA